MLFCESNGRTTSSGGLIKNNKIFYYRQRFESLSLFFPLQGYVIQNNNFYNAILQY